MSRNVVLASLFIVGCATEGPMALEGFEANAKTGHLGAGVPGQVKLFKKEICDNNTDDDGDGKIDETPCQTTHGDLPDPGFIVGDSDGGNIIPDPDSRLGNLPFDEMLYELDTRSGMLELAGVSERAGKLQVASIFMGRGYGEVTGAEFFVDERTRVAGLAIFTDELTFEVSSDEDLGFVFGPNVNEEYGTYGEEIAEDMGWYEDDGYRHDSWD